MIPALIALAAASAAPATAGPPVIVSDLLAGAEHAVQAERIDQAKMMIARAIAAGGAGQRANRVIADIAYASGRHEEALAAYESLLKAGVADARLLTTAGIAALRIGNLERASTLLSRATSMKGVSWRAWNALGAVADLRSDWRTADECFAEAARLAPSEVGPVNNHGWSLLLRGKWAEALSLFEQAIAMSPKSIRTANNLELARAALAADLPQRRAGETPASWAARLNDAGLAAAILGDKARATAAFTQAIDASGTWYARAANNLEALAGR